MSVPFAAEKQVAVAAVRRACLLTSSVFNKLVKNETMTKDDKSPVTGGFIQPSIVHPLLNFAVVGDFGAQAVVSTILGRTFPGDPIVGEEDAEDLRLESGSALRQRIVELANETLTAELSIGEMEEWGLGPSQAQTTEQLLDAIDRGTYAGGRTGREFI